GPLGHMSIFEKDLMAYFDENLNRNWRGREHWKVRNFKKANKSMDTKKKHKQKKVLEIDFFKTDDSFEDKVFASKGRTKIDMPIKNRKNDTHYLLPDDFHFSTDRITRLFIKPGQKMSLFSHRKHT
uniref:Condensin complex subunit 2 n=1 Tax=Saccharomyces cerevisiae (strain ATCC 204508 / S288c) TaxID=559292 RepID=UPI000BEE821F|nr:Chain B, Condensin complex subunit 2 [Saccharomyces cerevisiae S288C]